MSALYSVALNILPSTMQMVTKIVTMNLPACNQTKRVRTVDGAHEVYTVNLFREALVDGRETVSLHATA